MSFLCIRTSRRTALQNRCHSRSERAATRPILEQLIDILQPSKIVAIGNDAQIGLADLGIDCLKVLVSEDFVYWGNLAPSIPPHLRDFEGDDLYPNNRNFRNSYSEEFVAAAMDWFSAGPKGRRGRPINWD